MEQKKKTVEPIELEILCKDVVKRYPIDKYMEIVRCKTCFFFHAAGIFTVVKPTIANNGKGGALFQMMEWYCDYKDSRDTLEDKDMLESYDTLCLMIENLMTVPLDAFTDVEFMINISNDILKRRDEYYKKVRQEASVEREETLEDELENLDFQAEVLVHEAIINELESLNDAKINEKQNQS